MNQDSDQPQTAPSRSVSITAQRAARPELIPMLGAAIGMLYVLMHNLLSLL